MTISSNATRSEPITQPAAGVVAGPRHVIRWMWQAIKRARKRAIGRYELLAMDAHARADIGLSPGEAHFEGSKSFWHVEARPYPDRTKRRRP